MSTISLDVLEKKGLEVERSDLIEKMDSMNKSFGTTVMESNGFYGEKTIDRGNGHIIDIARNELGQLSKDYYFNGKLYQNKFKIADGYWEKTKFDDNGLPYLKETFKFAKNMPREYFAEVAADARIVKDNFTAVTDSLGRAVLNTVEDVQLREGERQGMSTRRTTEYKSRDERGHIIADSLGGPSSAENVVAQLKEVNHEKFVEVENLVRKIKRENPDSKIDYSVKTNYADKTTRPSSFEPKILVDGMEVDLPKDLQKIFNYGDVKKTDAVKIVAKEGVENVRSLHYSGLGMGADAAFVTCAISTVDNVTRFSKGEISAEEMVVDIAKETGTAGAIGYGTGFVSKAVSEQMLKAGSQMIREVGGSSVPVATVTFAVTSFESVNEFAQGKIDLKELSYDLGENAVGVAGSIEGAKYGAIAGTVVGGPAGAMVGGFVGGMVGYAVTTEAYATVVEYGGEGADILADKAQKLATSTYESAKEIVPEKAENIKSSLLDFASKAKMPIEL